MNKFVPLAVIGGIIITIVSFLIFNAQNSIVPYESIEVTKGLGFAITIPYTNNHTSLEEPIDVKVILITPAVLSLINYEVVDAVGAFKTNNNNTESKIARLYNSTYTIKYEGLYGKKELSGDNISGVSFDAKVGTDVTYELSRKILLLEGEKIEFKFLFGTNAAQIGTYGIKAFVNDHSLLYRVKVKT